ncbi:hypothetical protein HHK36_006899 [Tetracentron sinense]|uniref:F-box domain-containing protein n=1 Tax=Tetracentron sinense TaxID=13715 RepID=A0A835DKS2_TETSI|nr:hypothetical protein HHK36_006899 [Tetracentron sinense]
METPLDPLPDIISNLPEHVMVMILVHLPIKDAVRTCVLSRKWRYIWPTIPELVFDENNSNPCSNIDKTPRNCEFVNFIDRVLLVHKGPIHKFYLNTYLQNYSVVSSWMLFLSRNGVKDLTLSFLGESDESQYEVPSSLFSCETLCYLNLSCFILEPPPMFNGFGNLKSLRLESVTLTDEALERMIFTCTVLERLVLYELIGCFRFKIRGPCLQYFYLIGEFNNICFDDAPRLSSAVMGSYYCAVDEHVGQGETSNLNKALGCLTGLEKLGMYHHFLQILARGSIPERLPVTLDYLKSITLEMNFNDLDETSVVLCLLRSSPNLQELWLQVSGLDFTTVSVEEFWEAQHCLDCSMNQLRVVKVSGISGARPQLEVIKFLLANSPVLEILSVTPWPNIKEKLANSPVLEMLIIAPRPKVKEKRMLQELVRFPCASSKAEIEYNSEFNDED